jgi:hypothetical protein
VGPFENGVQSLVSDMVPVCEKVNFDRSMSEVEGLLPYSGSDWIIGVGEVLSSSLRRLDLSRRLKKLLHEQYAIVEDKVYGRSYWLALIATAVRH